MALGHRHSSFGKGITPMNPSPSRLSLLIMVITLNLVATSMLANEQKSWADAEKRNSLASYRNYLKKNSSGEHRAEAQRRSEDSNYAFWITCKIGTVDAIDGFLASNDSGNRSVLLKQFRDYLVATSSQDNLTKFLGQPQSTPFVAIARARRPDTFLSAVKATVGVHVVIESVVFKGLASRSNNPATIRERLFRKYQEQLQASGLDAVSLDGDENRATHAITHVLEVKYGENLVEEPPQILSSPQERMLAGMASILSSTFFRPAETRIRVRLYAVPDGRVVLSNISDLSKPANLESPEMSLAELGIPYSEVRLPMLMATLSREPSVEVGLARFGLPAEIFQFFSPILSKTALQGASGRAIAAAAALNPEAGTFAALIQMGLSRESAMSGLVDALPSRPLVSKSSQAKWMLLAEGGDAEVERNIGDLYATGQVFPVDSDEALKWYHMSAQQGSASAEERIGTMYETGRGVREDDLEAIRWFRLAAQRGLLMAYDDLGKIYQGGKGVAQDLVEAKRSYEFAAERGFGPAQNHLGIMYSDGIGIAQDYVLAMKWFLLAVNSHVADAINNRDFVASKLKPSQLAEAKSLAAHWQPMN